MKLSKGDKILIIIGLTVILAMVLLYNLIYLLDVNPNKKWFIDLGNIDLFTIAVYVFIGGLITFVIGFAFSVFVHFVKKP